MASGSLSLSCPSRLAFGLANLSGNFGGFDGGVGVGCIDPSWKLRLTESERNEFLFHTSIDETLTQKATETLKRLSELYGLKCKIEIEGGIPQHVGLGSTTSLLSGIYAGYCKLMGIKPTHAGLGNATKRGGTSGIGCNIAFLGGWVWDLGHSASDKTVPLPSSEAKAAPPMAIPIDAAKNVGIVHFSLGGQGLHGKKEVDFFKAQEAISECETNKILAILSGGLVPSLSYGDVFRINECIGLLQCLGLKKSEWLTQSPEVLKFKSDWEATEDSHSVGLSSMGPTMYILTDSPEEVASKVTRLSGGNANVYTTSAAMPLDSRVS